MSAHEHKHAHTYEHNTKHAHEHTYAHTWGISEKQLAMMDQRFNKLYRAPSPGFTPERLIDVLTEPLPAATSMRTYTQDVRDARNAYYVQKIKQSMDVCMCSTHADVMSQLFSRTYKTPLKFMIAATKLITDARLLSALRTLHTCIKMYREMEQSYEPEFRY